MWTDVAHPFRKKIVMPILWKSYEPVTHGKAKKKRKVTKRDLESASTRELWRYSTIGKQ